MALGFGLILGLLLLLLGLALTKLHALDVKERNADAVIAARADEAVNIQTAFMSESIALHSYIATREPAYLKTEYAAQQERRRALERLGGLPKTPESARMYKQIVALSTDFERLAGQVVPLVETRRAPAQVDELEGRLRAVRTDLIEATWQFSLLQRQERIAEAHETGEIRASLLRLLCILSVLMIAIGVLVAWLTIQAVRRPALRLVEAIGAMKNGDYRAALDLAHQYPPATLAHGNELHFVSGTYGRMAEVIQRREAELAVKNRQLKLQNEKLHGQGEQLQKQSDELQAQNEELQRALESLQASELALRQQTAALAEADRRKDEFLAMLAHELRNPLAAITNANYVLERSESSPARMQQMRGMISRQLRHLSRLIDDLLDVSRITRGKVALRKEGVDLGRTIQSAVEASQETAARAGLTLTVSLPGEAAMVQADPLRLEQMIANLLGNAIKFTESGGQIWVDLAREGEWAVARVRDTGIGITAQMLPHVFEMFAQADSGIDRAKGGLGIGLTLVQKLAGMHGGSVEARSEGLGRGSEFILRLPLAEQAEATMEARRAEGGARNG